MSRNRNTTEIVRGTVEKLERHLAILNAFFGGEAKRHAIVGLSCVDCRDVQCRLDCGGMPPIK